MTAEPMFGPGHNRPPLPIGKELSEALLAEHSALVDKCSALLDGERRVPEIDSDAAAGKVSEFIKQITAAHKAVESVRVNVKEPYLEGGRRVDGFFRGLTDPLGNLKMRVEKRLSAYLRIKADQERREREERERIAREEAARKQRQAEEAAAKLRNEEDLKRAIEQEQAAKDAAAEHQRAVRSVDAGAADMSRTRSEEGAVASLRTDWTFRDLDRDTVNLEKLRPHLAEADIEKAVRGYIRAGGRILEGVTIYEAHSAVVR